MDLFPVQRYQGDGDSSTQNDESAKANMCKLLSKIKQRSRLKKIQPPNKVNDNILDHSIKSDGEVSQVKKKHKKKSFHEGEVQTPQETVNNSSNIQNLENEMENLKFDDSEDENDDDVNQKLSSKMVGVLNSEIFPVIGDYKFKKKSKVKRVLPDWLSNPSVVSVDLKNLDVSITDIPGLHETFITTLKKNNISHFFPVQAQVIPWLLNSTKQASFFWPCDICVSAPTGSGKTLAYVLPILQGLMGTGIGQVQAVVVLPVQDLAAQVAAVFRTYCVGTGLKVHLSTGGLPLTDDRASLLRFRLGVGWESLADILVITPGRLVEHLYSTTGFSLKHLKYIVIDEADRIIDNMQNNWLHHLDLHLDVQSCPQLTLHNLRTLPRRPQKLLFSATLSIDPEKLNTLNLFQPRLFTSVVEATKDQGRGGEFVGKFTTPAELEERLVHCKLAVKPLVLYQLITRNSWSRVLVFTSSSRSVHQLCALLTLLSRKTQTALTVAEISAECSPKKREAVLEAFTEGKVDVLVSTDALARGMDIPGVLYVISYDMPKYVKAYVHRVGRTGRAGQQGTAVTIVTHSQVGLFNQMLETAGKQDAVKELTVDEVELRVLEEPFKDALKELKNITEKEVVKNLQKTKSSKRLKPTKVFSKKRKKNKEGGNVNKKLKIGH